MSTPNLTKAMVQAYKIMGPVTKDKKNPAFHSEYASLDAVLATIHTALSSVGLQLIQECQTLDNSVEVSTSILHESGEERVFKTMRIPVKPSEKMNIAQCYASAITYAKRYVLGSIFCLSTETDDDGNAAAPIPREEEPKKRLSPEQRKEKMNHDEIVCLAMETLAKLQLPETEFGKLKDWLVYSQSQKDGAIRSHMEGWLSKPNGVENVLKAYEQWKEKTAVSEPKILEMNG
jgi:hypothetical protein